MKTILSILGVVAMLFACIGCKADPKQDTPATSEAATTTSHVENADSTTQTKAGTTTQATEDSTTQATPSKTTGSVSSQKSTTTTTSKTLNTTEYPMLYYPKYEKYITVRGGLKNTGYRITQDGKLTVAFMGGSVTNGMGSTAGTNGFRARLLFNLQLAYDAVFSEITSDLGGNGSQYGMYVTDRFIASKKPDIVFIEYAVNNAYDGVTDAETLWVHYESMIHMIRKANPYADIVLVYVSDQSNASREVIPELEKIAKKYDLPSVNLYKAINNAIRYSENTWKYYYSDHVHMSDNGYDLSAEVLQGLIEYGVSQKATDYQKMATPTPKSTIQSEAKAVFTSELATLPTGWAKSAKFSYVGAQFGGCIETTAANKPITVKFKGTDFGVLVEFAADAGKLEYSIDGGAYQTLDCNLSYSNPKARLLLKNGTNGEHTITMRMKSGSRMAIAAFLLNGTDIRVE